MKIEVGEYFRTKQGSIHKAKSVYKDMIWWCDLDWIDEKEIVKHSKNIIDLIEVGDYVNGELIYSISDYDNGNHSCLYTDGDTGEILISEKKYILSPENYKIKTIVTKESFKNAEYKVED